MNKILPHLRSKHGFTLIELLVVIAIVGVLAAIITTNFVGARNRAYDAKSKQDLLQLKTALHSYYINYHSYPSTDIGIYLKACGSAGNTRCTTGNFTAGGTEYMSKLPSSFFYYGCSTGDDFRLKVTLKNKSDPDIAASQLSCPACGTTYNIDYDYVLCGND